MTSDDLQVFKDIVGDKGMMTSSDDLKAHNTDWSKNYIGESQLMLMPETNEEVSLLLKHCNERKLAVTP